MCHYKKKPLPIKLTQSFIMLSIVRCISFSEMLKVKEEKCILESMNFILAYREILTEM